MDSLELVGSGRDADVFRLGEDRVLRRYREGRDATREAEIMAFVAAHGYPVPAVYDVEGSDLVMELLDGPTMATALMAGALEISAGAWILADLHNTPLTQLGAAIDRWGRDANTTAEERAGLGRAEGNHPRTGLTHRSVAAVIG